MSSLEAKANVSSLHDPPPDKEQVHSSSVSTRSGNESHEVLQNPKLEESHYLHGLKLNILVFGLCISILLVALDNAILATAVPTITTQFNSLDDVGWYGSAFLIAVCACQPVGGKLYQYFSMKWTYMTFLAIFEIGSLICGVAPNSIALIVGRAVAGMGASGLYSGGLVIITWCIEPKLRPVYTSTIMAAFALANIIGPILGGAFTQHVSWRWCFYINLPLGAVSAVILLFVFNPPARRTTEVSLKEKIDNLDLPGFLLFAPAIVMLLLAINWGGTAYPWNSSIVVGLLCGGSIAFILFGLWEWRQQDKASIPPKVLRYRSMYLGIPMGALIFGSMQVILYYVPIWFQAIKDESPTQSGINIFPTILGNLLLSLSTGVAVSKFGYFNQFLFFGSAMIAIGTGLYTTWRPDTGTSTWIGYQIITGAGMGSIMQMPMVSIQATLPLDQIAMGSSALAFCQFLGGSIFLAIASSLFRSEIIRNLTEANFGGDIEQVLQAGAEGFRRVVDPQELPLVLEAYNSAVVVNFYIPVAAASTIFLLSFGMKWINVKNKKQAPAEVV